MLQWLTKKFLAPKLFYFSSKTLLPWLIIAFFILFTYSLIAGLFFAPADYQQGDGFRIIYVHVPSALTAMAVYLVMAISAFLVLVFRLKIAALAMSCSAPIGASFTLLALITGSLWGKPMWGTFWIWDARLTSVLVLLFLYIGFMSLNSIITQPVYRERACSVLALVGVINLPIIHYSVIWWNTLHQGPSISKFARPSIAPLMLYPLLTMIVAFMLFYIILLFIRMQSHILLKEQKAEWVRRLMI